MENALLIGLSRQMALSRELDVIANNVANVATTGFKARSLRFEEYLAPEASADAFAKPDQPLSYVVDKASGLDMSAGPLEMTGRELDVALRGPGVFAVQTPEGERYTRNGAFEINAAGELVTSDGYKVLGDGGPLVFGANETAITFAADGTVSSSDGVKGRLKLLQVNSPSQLENVGANIYRALAALQPAQPDVRVQGGAVERSNVNAVTEMSRLIEVNRAYQSVSSMIQRNDELRRSAIEKLAAPPA
ncbi:flagellar basal-body rod protein FlgF [Alsobacter sp. SYSU M60028]|uniref:Flagellar basal-body rod protein FlgF n=1 Tax=Alsobacter ponti TaxID=2962936 RepID=A0ABT1L8S6_9HYPH|nr:flagellar basal-body rod protein FlgF [Alsobacter ponti]MCP8937328.1 flagellar basal-body rod protein FlgF [Alsobacter ponti]